MKLNAKELRDVTDEETLQEVKKIDRNDLYIILENVYDTYNVGGLFRLADALCVKKMYLCGEMETPPNSRIMKASIGTYKIVPWEYKKTAAEAIDELKETHNNKIQVLAVEQDATSSVYTKTTYTTPVALLVGNETYGVLPETLQKVDTIVEIPMWGINKSLNVIVSAAIVAFEVMRQVTEEKK